MNPKTSVGPFGPKSVQPLAPPLFKSWVAIASIVIATVACLATIILGLTTSENVQHNRAVAVPGGIQVDHVWIGNVTQTLVTTTVLSDAAVHWIDVPFQARYAHNRKAICLPNGLRADICTTYGLLDTSPHLYDALASCRVHNVSREQFVGTCRVSDSEVLDVCLSADIDIDWSMCRTINTDCPTSVIPGNLVNITTTASEVARFDVPTFSVNTSIDVHMIIGITPMNTGRNHVAARVRLQAVNNGMALIGTPITTEPLLYAGETTLAVSATINASSLASLSSNPVFHVNQFEVWFGGVPINSRVRIIRVSLSSCNAVPVCQNSSARLIKPNPFIITSQIDGDEHVRYAILFDTDSSNWTMPNSSTLLLVVQNNGCSSSLDGPLTGVLSYETVFANFNTTITQPLFFVFSQTSLCNTTFDFRVSPQYLMFPGSTVNSASTYAGILGSLLSTAVGCSLSVTAYELPVQCDNSIAHPPEAYYPCSGSPVYVHVDYPVHLSFTLGSLQASDNSSHLIFPFKQELINKPLNHLYAPALCTPVYTIQPSSLTVYIRILGRAQGGWDLRSPIHIHDPGYNSLVPEFVILVGASYKYNSGFPSSTTVNFTLSHFVCIHRDPNDIDAQDSLDVVLDALYPGAPATISEFASVKYIPDMDEKIVYGNVSLIGPIPLTQEQAPPRTVDFSEFVPVRCDTSLLTTSCISFNTDVCVIPYTCHVNGTFILTLELDGSPPIQPGSATLAVPIWIGVAPHELIGDAYIWTDAIRDAMLPVAVSAAFFSNDYGYQSFMMISVECEPLGKFQMYHSIRAYPMSYYIMGSGLELERANISIEYLSAEEATPYLLPELDENDVWCKPDSSVPSGFAMVTGGARNVPNIDACLFASLAPGISPSCCVYQTEMPCFY